MGSLKQRTIGDFMGGGGGGPEELESKKALAEQTMELSLLIATPWLTQPSS